MGLKKNPICHLQHIPKKIRLLLAAGLTAIGLFLFVLPTPGGIVMVSVGLLLAYCSSETLRARIIERLKDWPRIAKVLTPFLSACDACSQAERTNRANPALPLESTRIDKN